MTTKKIQNIWQEITSFENLCKAYEHAKKNKRYRNEVLAFTENLEANLFKLQKELRDHTYHCGEYRQFYVYDPKKRLIMALPFRDRVVQWAVYQVVNPVFAAGYITDSYACIEGRGTQQAVARIQYWLRKEMRHADKRFYYLKLDISKYYYRISHRVVMRILKRKIFDDDLIWYFDQTVNSDTMAFGLPLGKNADEVQQQDRLNDVGMPIGSLISQMLANINLNPLDQYAKRTLGIRYYCRYMDDIIILHESKPKLHEWKAKLERFLNEELELHLNNKTALRPCTLGIDFCGYKIWNTHIKLRKSTALRMKHRLKHLKKQYSIGKTDIDKIKQTLASYNGILKHCDSYSLRKAIAKDFVLKREWDKIDNAPE